MTKKVTSITSKNEEYEIADVIARREKLNISDLPHNLSDFNNDLNLIDRAIDNLLNYYRKSETYSREEIQELLTARLTVRKVNALPTEDISTSTIYFVRKNNGEQDENDYYDEYIWVDSQWELIGNTHVDLTDYYTKSEAEVMAQSKVDNETTARENSESLIQGSIQTLSNRLNADISNLSSEIEARTASDMVFRGQISELNENLNDEISRATSAESTLASRCDTADFHISSTNNPHNVTKSQIGLGNVVNVSTDNAIIEDSSNNVSGGAVYNALQNKVDKVTGKGLSDQNFTFAEKTKLAGLSNYDDTNLDSRVTATESAIVTLNGDSSVSGSVDKKIADALENITGFDFRIVEELPQSGAKGIIYLVAQESGAEQDNYDEYIWLNSAWEYLGRKQVTIDLSNYYTKAQTNALISVKQDKITVADDSSALTDTDTFNESEAGTNGTTVKRRRLPSLWVYIKNKFETYFGIFFHDDDLRIFNDNGDIEIGEPNDENFHVTHITNDCNVAHQLGVGGSVSIEGDMSVKGEINQIGTLANLTTTAKTNLVSAINEAVAEKDKYWGGTQAKWEQFETDHPEAAEKVEVRYITDDSETGSVADVVENGNMRAVTSNAVYDTLVNTTIIQSNVKRNETRDPTQSTWYSGSLPKPTIPSGKRLVRWLAFIDVSDIAVSVGSRNGDIDNCILIHGNNDLPHTPITFNIWWGAEIADL